MLGEYQSTISGDIEHAAGTSDKFRLHSEFLGELGRQTGGLR